MLSVRRSGVTTTIHELEDRKLIKASRGQLTLLDRPGLEKLQGRLTALQSANISALFDFQRESRS
jgi:hypothetical protein